MSICNIWKKILIPKIILNIINQKDIEFSYKPEMKLKYLNFVSSECHVGSQKLNNYRQII